MLLPITLAGRLGLGELVDNHVDLGEAPGRANVGDQMLTLVASALMGGDCIDGKDGKQRFGLDRSTVTTTDRLQRLLVRLLLACCLLILVVMRVSPSFQRGICSRGKLGILNLGYEYYLATPDPPPVIFTPPPHQTGYA